MTVKQYWLVPHRVLIVESIYEVTMEDILVAGAEIERMLHMVGGFHTVYVILEDTHLQIPPSFNMLRKATWMQSPQINWIIAVGLKSRLIKMLGAFIGQYFGLQWRFFDTLDEAYSFLCEIDETLPAKI